MKTSFRLFPAGLLVIGLATGSAAQNSSESYIADLYGENVVPGPGDRNGTGLATFDWDEGREEFCYALAVDDVDRSTDAHIHRGEEGVVGPEVVELSAPGPDGGSFGCIVFEEPLRAEISANPSAFYVNIHTESFPGGAVRGQLER